MLKQRIITALLLAASVFAGVLYLPSPAFAAFLALIVLPAAWEWSRIAGWQQAPEQFIYVFLSAIGMILLYVLHRRMPHLEISILWLAALWWGSVWLWIVAAQRNDPPSWLSSRWLKSLFGALTLLPAWLALSLLHEYYAKSWILFLFMLIWTADIGAFFAGRRWGKHKLAWRISPGKSWEGVWGALAAVALLAVLYSQWQKFDAYLSVALITLSLLTAVMSILGDLLESLFKRQMQMKDSSRLLPGHGGVLDRVDSLTAAAPIFLLGLLYWHPGEHV